MNNDIQEYVITKTYFSKTGTQRLCLYRKGEYVPVHEAETEIV